MSGKGYVSEADIRAVPCMKCGAFGDADCTPQSPDVLYANLHQERIDLARWLATFGYEIRAVTHEEVTA